jgi:hypothetical protein
MAYTSKQTARETQAAEDAAAKQTAPAFTDQRVSTGVQLQQQQMMHTAQAKFATAQRAGVEEEEPLQGKFAPVQRAEEEELLQGKFATAQRAGVEDEEPLQGKFDTVQRAEEEELLQGKFATAQRAGVEEEEPLQGKFATTQLAAEEELLQGKFSTDISSQAIAQREEKPNNTGLPNQLKSGIESLSGMSLDNVKVHYNSSKPAQLNAHAYAQGSDIHVAPGQEQHLPHEAWHVVQQAQGRVKPTTQMKGTSVNDDVSLETEADVMGAKAAQLKLKKVDTFVDIPSGKGTAQLYDVVRGGTCLEDQFVKGSGVSVGDEGKLSGVSTQSKDGVDRNTLCGFFKNGQVGVADSSAVTAAGGELVHDGHAKNPNHATINGLTGAKLETLFTPTIPNPNKKK